MAEPLQIRCIPVGEIQENCYIVFIEDRTDCLLIDPGDEPERIRANLDGRTIAAVLLTHGHFDHIGAVGALAGPETEILIHEADADMLRDPDRNSSWMLGVPVTAPPATRTFRDGDVLEYAGCRLQVLHTPGHTPGSSCFALGEYLFTGDTVMSHGYSYGRTDLPGGSERQMRESLRLLMPLLRKYTVLGGHG